METIVWGRFKPCAATLKSGVEGSGFLQVDRLRSPRLWTHPWGWKPTLAALPKFSTTTKKIFIRYHTFTPHVFSLLSAWICFLFLMTLSINNSSWNMLSFLFIIHCQERSGNIFQISKLHYNKMRLLMLSQHVCSLIQNEKSGPKCWKQILK